MRIIGIGAHSYKRTSQLAISILVFKFHFLNSMEKLKILSSGNIKGGVYSIKRSTGMHACSNRACFGNERAARRTKF